MRRAFIRLFGCVLSAIGLGVSYDTTMTVVLGDKAAPGAAWAASGASGCFFNSGCVPATSTLSGAINLKMSGSCTVDGSDITYNVVLVPWYVGWLNHNYNNGNNSMTGDWPLIYTNGFKTSAMALGFSGDSFSGNVSGYFVGTWRNVKGTAGDILDLCDNDQWLSGAHLGLSTGIGDNPSSRSFRGSCVMNRDEVGGFSYEYYSEGTMKYGAVYLYGSEPFRNAGCCEYSGSGSDSNSTSCPCFYAPATKSYSYKYYETASYSKPNPGWRSTSTVTFYEPFVFYYFEGCKKGYYKEKLLNGESGNFALNLLSHDAYAGMASNSYIRDVCAYRQVGTTPSDENATRNYENIWGLCQECDEMTELYLQNRYKPTISSWGKAEPTTSANGVGDSTCRVDVSSVKDEIGTYNFTESCTPTY